MIGHIIFLGAFFGVVTIIVLTVAQAMWRSRGDLLAGRQEHIRWHGDFADLPARDRICRHVLTGEFKSRQCPNGFDCRKCETHNRWVERHPVAAADRSEEDMFGMAFPLDRFYHRGHTWVHVEPDGTVTIGLDDLGRRLLDTPEAVTFPAIGSHIEVNGPAFRVRKSGSEVRVLAPLSGRVMETAGLSLRVLPDSLDLRHLLRGVEVRPWVLREMERLQLASAGSLADGGVPVGADVDTVAEMFLDQ